MHCESIVNVVANKTAVISRSNFGTHALVKTRLAMDVSYNRRFRVTIINVKEAINISYFECVSSYKYFV